MTISGAFDQTQDAFGDEATNRAASGSSGKAHGAGEPVHGDAEARATFEECVAEEKRVDGAVGVAEAKGRDENVFEVFPEDGGVEFFVGHG